MTGKARRFVILLLVPIVLALSSCVRLEADFEVMGTDEARVGIDVAVQTSILDDEEDLSASELCSVAGLRETEGLLTVPYEEDGYSGCRQTGTSSLSETAINNVLTLDDDSIWRFSLGGGTDEVGGVWPLATENFDDFRVSVKFPGEVLSHSGSSTVRGTTVTWTDAEDFITGEGLNASAEHAEDLGWLSGLIGVITLFVLGGIFYKVRNPRRRPDPNAPHAPEGRIVVKRGGRGKFKQSGPYDYGPQLSQDPSSVPKFYHHHPGP